MPQKILEGIKVLKRFLASIWHRLWVVYTRGLGGGEAPGVIWRSLKISLLKGGAFLVSFSSRSVPGPQ